MRFHCICDTQMMLMMIQNITYVLLYQLLTDCFTVNLWPSSLLTLCIVHDFASLCLCRCVDVCVLCCVRIPQPLYNWMKSIIQSEAFVQLLVFSHMPRTQSKIRISGFFLSFLFWRLIRMHLLSHRCEGDAQYKRYTRRVKRIFVMDTAVYVCVPLKRGNTIVARLFQWLAWTEHELVCICVPHCVYSYSHACVWVLMCALVEWTENAKCDVELQKRRILCTFDLEWGGNTSLTAKHRHRDFIVNLVQVSCLYSHRERTATHSCLGISVYRNGCMLWCLCVQSLW